MPGKYWPLYTRQWVILVLIATILAMGIWIFWTLQNTDEIVNIPDNNSGSSTNQSTARELHPFRSGPITADDWDITISIPETWHWKKTAQGEQYIIANAVEVENTGDVNGAVPRTMTGKLFRQKDAVVGNVSEQSALKNADLGRDALPLIKEEFLTISGLPAYRTLRRLAVGDSLLDGSKNTALRTAVEYTLLDDRTLYFFIMQIDHEAPQLMIEAFDTAAKTFAFVNEASHTYTYSNRLVNPYTGDTYMIRHFREPGCGINAGQCDLVVEHNGDKTVLRDAALFFTKQHQDRLQGVNFLQFQSSDRLIVHASAYDHGGGYSGVYVYNIQDKKTTMISKVTSSDDSTCDQVEEYTIFHSGKAVSFINCPRLPAGSPDYVAPGIYDVSERNHHIIQSDITGPYLIEYNPKDNYKKSDTVTLKINGISVLLNMTKPTITKVNGI